MKKVISAVLTAAMVVVPDPVECSDMPRDNLLGQMIFVIYNIVCKYYTNEFVINSQIIIDNVQKYNFFVQILKMKKR